MKKRILLIVILVLTITGTLVYNHLDSIGQFGNLPKSLRQCPELPEGANYVIAAYDSYSSTVSGLFATRDYCPVTPKVNGYAPLQKSIWVGAVDEEGYWDFGVGYWVWGMASNKSSSRWHRQTGMYMLGGYVAIYDKSCQPIWNIWDNPEYPEDGEATYERQEEQNGAGLLSSNLW